MQRRTPDGRRSGWHRVAIWLVIFARDLPFRRRQEGPAFFIRPFRSRCAVSGLHTEVIETFAHTLVSRLRGAGRAPHVLYMKPGNGIT